MRNFHAQFNRPKRQRYDDGMSRDHQSNKTAHLFTYFILQL